jgi:hypothetical protein
MNLNSISQCPTPLNQAFFCEYNQETVQRLIRQNIYNQFKVKIDKQSPSDILAIMRAVFINNSADPYNDVYAQVKYMNDVSMKTACKQIETGLAQHFGYLEDIARPIQPPNIPTNTSLYGNKIGYNDQIGF